MPLPKEKRYTIEDILALPEGTRAELINGQMYMMAAPTSRHQRMVMRASGEIYSYIRSHDGNCEVYPAPYGVFLSDDTDFLEPDVSVICDPSKIDSQGCHGAPDWVIEIVSPSSRGMDYMTKLFLYRAAGVREYWIVDPEKDRVTVYRFSPVDALNEVEEYSMGDPVPAGIYDNNLTITFGE